jgi:hypothetical protein
MQGRVHVRFLRYSGASGTPAAVVIDAILA